MLQLEQVSAGYGGVSVLRGVSLQVATGQFVTLIGANGAGKSTTLRTISGLLLPTSGSIKFEDTGIGGSGASGIVRKGITHCPEGRRIFPMMTVHENLLVGGHVLSNSSGARGRARGCLSILSVDERNAAGNWRAAFPAASSRCSQSAVL